jgi:hypothetical protein
MANMPQQQEDIKVLIKREEGFPGQIIHGTNSYRRTMVNGRLVKAYIDNVPLAFGPSRQTPEGFYYAWCSDTDHNRKVLTSLVAAGVVMVDDESKLIRYSADHEMDSGAPQDLPEMDANLAEGEVMRLDELTRLSAGKLRSLLEKNGVTAPLGLRKQDLVRLAMNGEME